MTASFSNNEIKGLFLQLAKGDHTAFTELFYHYNKRFYPFVLKKVKEAPIAEELVQDIFLKLWANREHIGTLENPEGYLYRIASNTVLDHFKRLAYEHKVRKNQQDRGDADKGNPAAALQLKEIELLANEAVRQLPAQRKLVYQLREQGLSYQQIADKLGLSIHTVKHQLVDASKFIRNYLIQRGISLMLFIHFCLLMEKMLGK